MKNKDNKEKTLDYLSSGIGIGLLIGITLGCIFNNFALYISLGFLLGTIIAVIIMSCKKRKNKD